MRFSCLAFVPALCAWVAVTAAQDSLPVQVPERKARVDFQKEIFPVLKANCLACHNASDAEGDLILESPEAMRQGGFSGPAIVEGNSEDSLLFQVASHEGDIIMPPEKNAAGANNLTPRQLGLLKLWIDQGGHASAETRTAGIDWKRLPADLRPVYAVAVTPHGRYVAAGWGNRLFLYQWPTRRLLAELVDPSLAAPPTSATASPAAHLDLVQSLDFSPDGQRLASGGFRTIKIWKRSCRIVVESSRGESAPPKNRKIEKPRSLEWHDNVVQLCDEATGKVVRTFDLGRPVSLAVLSPEGTRLVALSSTGPARLWDAQSGEMVRELEGQLVLRNHLADAEQRVRVRERQRNHAQRDLGTATQRKQQAETALEQAQTEVEAAEKAANEAKEEAEQESADTALKAAREAFELNAPLVDRAAEDVEAARTALEEAVRAVSVATEERKKLQRQLASDRSLSAAAFSPDGQEIAVADVRGDLLTYSAAEGLAMELARLGPPAPAVRGLQYVGTRRLRVIAEDAAYEIDTLPVWELERTIGAIDDPRLITDRVTSLDFSPDGRQLAAGTGEPSRSGWILIFESATGEVIQAIHQAHSDTVLSLEFAPHGERLASGGADRFARLFNARTGMLEETLEGHSGHVTGVTWHPDARTIATASADGTVKLWDARSGQQQETIPAGDAPLTDVAFLGTDDMVVIAGGNRAVAGRKTDGSGGPAYEGATSFVHALATTADGQLILAGEEDGHVRVWRRDGEAIGALSP